MAKKIITLLRSTSSFNGPILHSALNRSNMVFIFDKKRYSVDYVFCISAKTRSDRDKLCHFWSKVKSQESKNKLFLFIASYLVHLILEGFCLSTFHLKVTAFESILSGRSTDTTY